MTPEPGKRETESHYVALSDLRPFAGATAVLLAARRSPDAEERTVIALSEADARWLHAKGRLHGWTPA